MPLSNQLIFALFLSAQVVTGAYYKADPQCSGLCEQVYSEAASCKLVLNAGQSPDGVLNFNTTCLCNPNTFREKAPGCIDCLFRADIEDEYRDALFQGMHECKSLGLPACPQSCDGLQELLDRCDAEDIEKAAIEAARTAIPTPDPTSTESNVTELSVTVPLATVFLDSATPKANVTTTIALEVIGAGKDIDRLSNGPMIHSRAMPRKSRKVKEDYTNKAVCRPENKEKVQRCYNCMKNIDVITADQINLPAARCDPNYGKQGPLYRDTVNVKHDDPETTKSGRVSDGSTTTSSASNTKTGSVTQKTKTANSAVDGKNRIITALGWIGVQIACVATVVYFSV